MFFLCVFFFTYEYLTVLVPFVEKAVLSSFNCPCPISQNYLRHICVVLFLGSLFYSVDICFYS